MKRSAAKALIIGLTKRAEKQREGMEKVLHNKIDCHTLFGKGLLLSYIKGKRKFLPNANKNFKEYLQIFTYIFYFNLTSFTTTTTKISQVEQTFQLLYFGSVYH